MDDHWVEPLLIEHVDFILVIQIRINSYVQAYSLKYRKM